MARYHEDGELLEKGSFKDGIQIGIWEYQLRCPPDIAKNVIDVQDEGMAPYYNGVDTYRYKVNYIQYYEPGCHIVCLESEIVE